MKSLEELWIEEEKLSEASQVLKSEIVKKKEIFCQRIKDGLNSESVKVDHCYFSNGFDGDPKQLYLEGEVFPCIWFGEDIPVTAIECEEVPFLVEKLRLEILLRVELQTKEMIVREKALVEKLEKELKILEDLKHGVRP